MLFLFEDPYITTGLNFVYVYQRLPEGPVFDGGEAQVLALQIRAAITEKLGFIATKDGRTSLSSAGVFGLRRSGISPSFRSTKGPSVRPRESTTSALPSWRSGNSKRTSYPRVFERIHRVETRRTRRSGQIYPRRDFL